ncbi:hypothetical protein MC885_017218 [Smutsia gigantea]|nr:hypothetical protein MC885_017218 [Smutsia gigantea]
MREQSAWLLPATPRARREDESVGAERRGPAAVAAANKRGPCSRAPEPFPQPRPPLLTPPPPPALGLLQQSSGSAATEGAASRRSPGLAPSAPSQRPRRAGGPAAATAPGLPEGACGAGATTARCSGREEARKEGGVCLGRSPEPRTPFNSRSTASYNDCISCLRPGSGSKDKAGKRGWHRS